MKKALAGAILFLMLAAGTAGAQYYGHPQASVVSERQQALVRLIDRGVRSGDISRREATRLYAEQRAIRDKERRYLRDGILTRAERQDLMRDLAAAERRIYNAMRDSHRRYVYRPY
jgi:hypothetical protein